MTTLTCGMDNLTFIDECSSSTAQCLITATEAARQYAPHQMLGSNFLNAKKYESRTKAVLAVTIMITIAFIDIQLLYLMHILGCMRLKNCRFCLVICFKKSFPSIWASNQTKYPINQMGEVIVLYFLTKCSSKTECSANTLRGVTDAFPVEQQLFAEVLKDALASLCGLCVWSLWMYSTGLIYCPNRPAWFHIGWYSVSVNQSVSQSIRSLLPS